MKKSLLIVLIISCLKSIKSIELKDKDINKELVLAINNCDISKVIQLINSGVNVNDSDDEGNSALILAAKEGSRNIVKFLLGSGADVNHKDNNGNTALMVAIEYGHKEIVKLLLKRGANVNHINNIGWSPLIEVALKGCPEIAEILIENGADVNCEDVIGKTAFMYACSSCFNEHIIDLLIEKGSDINCADISGYTSLISASLVRDINLLKLLIKRGADVNKRNSFGDTALTIGYKNGYKEIVELLISKGANIKELDNIVLQDSLIKSMENKEIITSLSIIRNYADKIDFKYKDNEGNGLLHYSVFADDVGLFCELIEKGCDINLENNRGETPLYFAINKDEINKLLLLHLLERGAILKPNFYKKTGSSLNILALHEKLLDELILEPRARKILGKFNVSDEDRRRLKQIIYVLKIKDQDFEKEKEMLNYIRNVFILKSSNIKLRMKDIENTEIQREELVDFDLEPDYILGAAFDLGKDEYYGDNSLENIREAFKDRLINIAQTKTPKSIPSLNANDQEKSNYVKYLTKKRLRTLGQQLSSIPEKERKEKLGWVMNSILTNLSCPTGTLEAINYALNCLLGNANDINLHEIIKRELMLIIKIIRNGHH